MKDNKDFVGIDLDNKDEVIQRFNETGFLDPSPWKICVGLYTGPEKHESGLIIPKQVKENQKYEACVGLVLRVGQLAYKDDKYKGIEVCKVGDWVVFPKNGGGRLKILGLTVWELYDDSIIATIKDPRTVSRG